VCGHRLHGKERVDMVRKELQPRSRHELRGVSRLGIVRRRQARAVRGVLEGTVSRRTCQSPSLSLRRTLYSTHIRVESPVIFSHCFEYTVLIVIEL